MYYGVLLLLGIFEIAGVPSASATFNSCSDAEGQDGQPGTECNNEEQDRSTLTEEKRWPEQPSRYSDAQRHWIYVVSDLCFSNDEAFRQVEERLMQELLKLVSEESDGSLSERVMSSGLARLRRAPTNVSIARSEERPRPYGLTLRHHVRLGISRNQLASWLEEQRLRDQRHRGLILRMCFCTAFLWTLALPTAAAIDRWTQGYRRPWIYFGLAALVIGSSLAWRVMLS